MVISSVRMGEVDKRDAAVAELLSSEASYVSDLKLLVDVFVLPLERWAKDLAAARVDDGNDSDTSTRDLTPQDCSKIFANAKQLAEFNLQFLVDLRQASGLKRDDSISPAHGGSSDWKRASGTGDAWYPSALSALSSPSPGSHRDLYNDPFKPSNTADMDRGPRQMLEVFLKSAPFLKMYSSYVNNFDGARERLTILERDNPSFVAFLTACENQKPCRGLRLRDFLLLPVQRIPRYRALLETILQHTSMESTMHLKVEESLTTMGGIASRADSDMTLQQRKDKVHDLQKEFGGAHLVTPTRLFVREGDLFKVARNEVEKLHFVLFNDLLVYGQARRRRRMMRGGHKKQLYHHRREIKLKRCFVVDAPSYRNRHPSFLGQTGMLVVSEEKSFMVMAHTAVEKDAWLQAIRLCMRDVSIKAESSEQEHGGGNPRSSPSRWLAGPANNPFSASAPRSVWAPGKDDEKSLRLVHFSLPAWAGVRASCGCLSHTELTWGKKGLGEGGVGREGGAGMARDVPGGFGIGSSGYGDDARGSKRQADNEGPHMGDIVLSPSQVVCVIDMGPFEPMGLRLRDVHPGCGGGVVVVGFENESAGKRAGVQQGDRIKGLDDVPVTKTADIVWALSQPHIDSAHGGGRAVHLMLTRGFPKSDKPWLPPLEPSPVPIVLSPPSSAVESRTSEEGGVSPVMLSAPGSRTFSGRERGGSHKLGFAADSGVGDDDGSVKMLAAEASAASGPGPGAAESEAIAGDGDSHVVVPPSPDAKSDNLADSSGDFSTSGDGTGDSADSSAGLALRGPAPQQANVNAGGDPAKPFAANTNTIPPRSVPRVLSPPPEGRRSRRSMGVGGALSACWTCQGDDSFPLSDEETSRPTEYKHVEAPSMKKLRGTVVGACVGQGDDDKADDDSDDFRDSRSQDSGSSAGSSLFLTAVSPRRIPTPLVSMASTLPPPPVSRTSSAVSGSFSNPWCSPAASQAETPDTSMPWLKPLPPPPPRREAGSATQAWANFSSGSTLSPMRPASSRGAMGLAYPSGRWVQTPPHGEPKRTPDRDLDVMEDDKGL